MTVDTSPAPYKDRRLGLVLFGALTVLLGAACGVMVLAMLGGVHTTATQTGQPPNYLAITPNLVTYSLLMAALIALGVGSIMARRWARALLLVFSWSWLVVGIVVVAVIAVVLPPMLAAMVKTTPENLRNALIILFGTLGFILVVLPAIWVFFYGSRHVKATCEARDPQHSWTDNRPLPVLGAMLWLGFSAVSTLAIAPLPQTVLPFFGVFLVGPPAIIACVIGAIIWGYCGWAIYHLKPAGWWATAAMLILMAVSTIITYSVHDVSEAYRLMGYSPLQIAQMQQTLLLRARITTWGPLVGALPLLGYLWYLRRFFPFAKRVETL